jgi:hypothetical protein
MANLRPLPSALCRQCGERGLTLNSDTNRRTCNHCGHVTVAREAFDDLQGVYDEDRRRGR